MTFQPVDWALTRDDLSAPKHLLLVTIAWLADGDGVTFKSQKTIAARLAKDPRWVREHLPELARLGLLTRRRRHRLDGSRTTDLIVLNLPRTAPLDLSAYSGIVGAPEPGDVEPSGENPPGGLAAETRQPSGENPPTVINPSDNLSPTEKTSDHSHDRADIQLLCERLASKVKANGYTVSDPLAVSWQTPIRQLLDRDHDPKTGANWTAEQVAHVIDHATSDPFWMLNVRSPASLRKHFERFVIAIRAASKPAPNSMQAKQDALVAQHARFVARAAQDDQRRLSA